MNIKELLNRARKELKLSQTGQLDSEILLCHVLGLKKEELITKSLSNRSNEEKVQFEHLVQERKKGKPIAYLTNTKEFFEREYFVDKRVLIPRPETEELLESATQYLDSHSEISQIIDIGTGSGCIAITLAKKYPEKTTIACDISTSALEVAQHNSSTYPCKNLRFFTSDLLKSLPETLKKSPSCVIANLPYIGRNPECPIDKDVHDHEPHIALYSGKDGMDHYRRLWEEMKQWPNIQALFCEISPEQVNILQKESKESLPKYTLEFQKDLAGRTRMALLKKN